MDRAVYGVTGAITRYRAGSIDLSDLVSGVEAWVGSMTEVADWVRLEAWRSGWNRLEFAFAMMLDEDRTAPTPEESEMVDGALTTLEEMCRPWTTLAHLERGVLEMLVAGDAQSTRRLQDQLAVCRVHERERTGVGFFTRLEVDRAAAGPIAIGSARVGDVVAEIDGLRHGAGFLLTIADGYLDELEGYTFDEPWPVEVSSFSLSYTEEPRDIAFLTESDPRYGPRL